MTSAERDSADSARDAADRAHGLALLLSEALGEEDPERVTRAAWQVVLADPTVTAVGLLPALLAEVLRTGRATDPPIDTRPPLGTFAGPTDRWAGWWDREPPSWDSAFAPGRRHAVDALRRLPPNARAALVLRDAAGLPVSEVGRLLDHRGDAARLVETARQEYLVAIDRVVADERG